jgi:hypothetical protein
MSAPDSPDLLVAVLTQHEATIVDRLTDRVQAEIPSYKALPRATIRGIMQTANDRLIASLRAHDPTQIAQHFEARGHQAPAQGISMEAQVRAVKIGSEICHATIAEHYPGDADAQTAAHDRIERVFVLMYHVVTRAQLAEMLKPQEP